MKLLDKSQELVVVFVVFFFFCAVGSYQECHTLLLLLVQCSSSVQLQWNILDGMKEEFWVYPQDSRIYSVLGRLAASHYKMALEKLCSVFSSLCVFFFMYESGRLCIRFWFMWSMNALQNTHSHKAISASDIQMSHVSKEFIQWHTQLKENIVLYRNISLKWILAEYQESAHVTKTTKRERKEKTKIEIG